MSVKHTIKRSLERKKQKAKTDWARIDQLSDDEIAAAVADDPDAAPLDSWIDRATVVLPEPKERISIRLDKDVLSFFRRRAKGTRGYQTLINAVLRSFMNAEKARR